jgi:CheY-like chemotaxis protein
MDNSGSQFRDVSVLVVDDNAFHRAIVIEILRSAGIWDVTSARNGMEGMEEIRLRRPKAILLDWTMDQIDGPTFVQLVRRSDNVLARTIPIIMVTAKARRQDVAEARAFGVDEYLVKPITAGALLEKLEQVLFRPRRFIDSGGYAGPCRRRRASKEYFGPKRRRADAAQPSRVGGSHAPLSASVQRLSETMQRLSGVKADARAVLGAAQETAALAKELNDNPLQRGAEALARYVERNPVVSGADPVLSTHATALKRLMETTEQGGAEREAVATALEEMVQRKLGRDAA